ncbi:hypothetical protein JOB18_017881 [Solea senegalensis]|uniref:FAM194 C-terminal domain-containing protein n=2 Tax=Solea senegalensis TaxID=28829 RepID=A0AAV6T6V3_SOLSE|nr:hypothetical protein JOB18_017881 [Solea senegalensis]
MRPSFSNTTAATCCIRAAGVLRYNRESENTRINKTTILPEPPPLTECVVKCEYCGGEARPSLDAWLQKPETAPDFCCAQWQQLSEGEVEELLFQGREMQDHNKLFEDILRGLGTQSEVTAHEDHSVQLPATETFDPTSKFLTFRLSCAPEKGRWTVYPSRTTEKCFTDKGEEAQMFVHVCGHKPLQFGICHHQHGAEFLHKYYSSGMKCLTVFADGSAQVFYPSGHLALIIVVTEENGRLCMVYEDSDAPKQTIRAVFQSDGRATCYHSNGNIWLSLNRLGGQCLDEAGARVRRWSWNSLTHTPLRPVFLSLNKSVGVRVFGMKQVFVSFLAQGQQAKVSVGACCVQGESEADGRTSITKEELLVSAARIRIHMAIQCLHQSLQTPSHPGLARTTLAPHLHDVAQRLQNISAHVMMSDSERASFHKYLEGCF